jgi:hypothetical protein
VLSVDNAEKQAQWLSARPTRNPIIERMRDSFDGGDPWGSTMEWWFAIADVITEIDPTQVPSDWKFRQALFGADTEAFAYQEIIETMRDDGATLEDLISAGNILTRYASLLKLNGQDY